MPKYWKWKATFIITQVVENYCCSEAGCEGDEKLSFSIQKLSNSFSHPHSQPLSIALQVLKLES